MARSSPREIELSQAGGPPLVNGGSRRGPAVAANGQVAERGFSKRWTSRAEAPGQDSP